ncbi:MAG: hypothetical protein IPM17_04950 [Verrucomicrobia bacterium]|nr:hypothetical protein [Verrucomicrobiota bacterium]
MIAFDDLTEQLRRLCRDEAMGLITRDEFERQLEELEWQTGPDYRIEEAGTSRGRRGFVVRHRRSGAVIRRLSLTEE